MDNKAKFYELMDKFSAKNYDAFNTVMCPGEFLVSTTDRYGCNHQKKYDEIEKVLNALGMGECISLMKTAWCIKNQIVDRKTASQLHIFIDSIEENLNAIDESGLIGFIPSEEDCNCENAVEILKDIKAKWNNIFEPIYAMIRNNHQFIDDYKVERHRNELLALLRPLSFISHSTSRILMEYEEAKDVGNGGEEAFLLSMIGNYLKLIPGLTPTLKIITVKLESMKEFLDTAMAVYEFQKDFIDVYNEMKSEIRLEK